MSEHRKQALQRNQVSELPNWLPATLQQHVSDASSKVRKEEVPLPLVYPEEQGGFSEVPYPIEKGHDGDQGSFLSKKHLQGNFRDSEYKIIRNLVQHLRPHHKKLQICQELVVP